MAERAALGIDIGGTKLAACLVTGAGDICAYRQVPTPQPPDVRRCAELLELLCRRVLQEGRALGLEAAAAGIACGGPLDGEAGLVQGPPNLPGWTDVPIVAWMQDALGLPAVLENDADAAALGEHRYGAGRGVRHLVYMTVSTGIGGGLILDGRLFRGAGGAGELGHQCVVYGGRLCGCGARGCLEAYASGRSVAARACEGLDGGQESALAPMRRKGPIDARMVAEEARRGDGFARRLWEESMRILGAGVANAVNAFGPERVVLGGGLALAGELLLAPVRREAAGRMFGSLRNVEILSAGLVRRSAAAGAAAAAMERLGLRMGE